MENKYVTIDSKQMKYILLKFLMDSLYFLANDPNAVGSKRGKWVEKWQRETLMDGNYKTWLPSEENLKDYDGKGT